ncbi:MAG: tetratricopeptide repeat protein [Ignavibacteriae bacterium]|nr:tetratricopeptide repeat protein [Ignavibacteriota bacterium]
MKAERYDDARPYLQQRYGLKPDAYSAKWLGTISLSKNNTSEAIRYLEESLKYDGTDTQVWYNLSGAYANSKDYQQALNAINKCLALDPAYPRAAGLQSQLLAATQQ